ncbi:MAG: rhomboid family intramembrane serine protease [Bryobacteraceae bacterium]|nr:rhomboid family intramembrane serine protease [Bryobacteraceae bacterium]
MDKRRMCANCRAFVTVDDKVCPYCDVPLQARAVDRRNPSDILGIPAHRFTTTVLLLINAGLYVGTTMYSMNATGQGGFLDIDGQTLVLFGAKYPPLIQAGQWWRLLTAGFLHGGILHILMNSWVIFDLGAQAEEFYGTPRYLVLYFLSTIGGFGASLWWSPSLSVGASAPLFGLMGAMLALGVKNRHTALGSAMRSHYTQWAIWGLAMGLMTGMRIDNAAHIGGLATGFAFAWIAGTPRLVESWADRVWKVAAAICVVITIAAFGLMVQFLLSVQRGSE